MWTVRGRCRRALASAMLAATGPSAVPGRDGALRLAAPWGLGAAKRLAVAGLVAGGLAGQGRAVARALDERPRVERARVVAAAEVRESRWAGVGVSESGSAKTGLRRW